MDKYLRLAVLFLGFLCFPATAQTPQGAITGTVVDPSGARVRGAEVTASAPQFALTRSIRTNSLGEFRIESLPPGNYEIRVEAQGFATQSVMIEVAVAAT